MQSGSRPQSVTNMVQQVPLISSQVTSAHPNEAGWSNANLPNLLFQLEPPVDWGMQPLRELVNQSGQPIMNGNRTFKHFPLLPNRIAVNPHEDFRLEMWRDRTDPRITTNDLWLRMHPVAGEKLLDQIVMNQRCVRFRKKLGITCWTRRTMVPSVSDCLLLEQVSPESIKQNTVLPVIPKHGLLKPGLDPNANRYGSQYIPLHTFTNGTIDHTPSEHLRSWLDILNELQTNASNLGYAHWIFLPNKYKPQSWQVKAGGQENGRSKGGRVKIERSRPDDVIVPAQVDITPIALEHIRLAVWSAAASGAPVPDLNTLSADTRIWVGKCIADGRNVFGSISHEIRSINNAPTTDNKEAPFHADNRYPELSSSRNTQTLFHSSVEQGFELQTPDLIPFRKRRRESNDSPNRMMKTIHHPVRPNQPLSYQSQFPAGHASQKRRREADSPGSAVKRARLNPDSTSFVGCTDVREERPVFPIPQIVSNQSLSLGSGGCHSDKVEDWNSVGIKREPQSQQSERAFAQTESAVTRNTMLQSKNIATQAENKRLATEAASIKATDNALQAENHQLKKQISLIYEQNKLAQANNNMLKIQNGINQARILGLEEQNASIQSEYNSLKAEHTTLQTRYTSLKTENTSWQREIIREPLSSSVQIEGIITPPASTALASTQANETIEGLITPPAPVAPASSQADETTSEEIGSANQTITQEDWEINLRSSLENFLNPFAANSDNGEFSEFIDWGSVDFDPL